MPIKPRAGTNRTPVRNELFFRLPMNDSEFRTFILRDGVVPEDPYLSLVQAKLRSIRTGDDFAGEITARTLKDDLIRVNIQI